MGPRTFPWKRPKRQNPRDSWNGTAWENDDLADAFSLLLLKILEEDEGGFGFFFIGSADDFYNSRNVSLYDEFAQMEVKAITYTGGGDSSLHPNIKEIVEKAHSVGLQQGFITNALKVAYDPTLLEWVRISLTNKPLPVDNIKILRACKTLGININYGGDEEEVKRTLEVAHKVGADYVEVRPALNLNGQLTNIEPPKVTDPLLKIIHYKFEEAKKPHGYTKCQGYHFVPFIWQTGAIDAR
jgi:hypothetical protein